MDKEDVPSGIKAFSETQKSDLELVLGFGSLTNKRWLRTAELAAYLGTTKDAIKQNTARRRLVPKKLWGRNYYDRLQIDSLIENSNEGSRPSGRKNRWR